MRATVRAALETEPLTVARIVALAGVGRTTFYECFDDVEHALVAAHGAAVAWLRSACFAGDGGLSLRWCRAVAREPLLVRVAIRFDATHDTGSLARLFGEALATVSGSGGVAPVGAADMTAACAVACAHALALEVCVAEPEGVGSLVERASQRLEWTMARLLGRDVVGNSVENLPLRGA